MIASLGPLDTACVLLAFPVKHLCISSRFMTDPKNSSRSFSLPLKDVFTILAFIAILGAGCYGWVHNIGKLMNNSCGQGNYGCLIVRGVGIPIVPVGAVAGYL